MLHRKDQQETWNLKRWHFVEICSKWPQLPKTEKSWGTKIKHMHTWRHRSNQDFSPAEQNKTSAGDLWEGVGGGVPLAVGGFGWSPEKLTMVTFWQLKSQFFIHCPLPMNDRSDKTQLSFSNFQWKENFKRETKGKMYGQFERKGRSRCSWCPVHGDVTSSDHESHRVCANIWFWTTQDTCQTRVLRVHAIRLKRRYSRVKKVVWSAGALTQTWERASWPKTSHHRSGWLSAATTGLIPALSSFLFQKKK